MAIIQLAVQAATLNVKYKVQKLHILQQEQEVALI